MKKKQIKPKLQVQKINARDYGIVDGTTDEVLHSEKSRYFYRKRLNENYSYWYRAALRNPEYQDVRSELEALKRKIDSVMEFGDIPRYSTEIAGDRIYVCRNDGAFHDGAMSGSGWATFVGRYTVEDCDLVV